MPNHFLNRMSKDAKASKAYRRSPKQEKDLSKRLNGFMVGGKTTRLNMKGGGRDRAHKGDVQVKGVARIEAKTTCADSFRVTKEMIEKINTAAMQADEVAAIVIEFLDPLGKPLKEMAVISVQALETLIANQRG